MRKKTKRILIGMIILTLLLAMLAVIFFLLYARYGDTWMYAAAITALTAFYHFIMRLAVGEIVTVAFRKKEFPQDKMGFKLHAFENDLYKKLKVKQWKSKAITAKPELFDLKKISGAELLHNVMLAELVHRIIVVLSFVPLLFIIPFGAPAVFIITSVIAGLIDLKYAVIQRYNRPRVLRYIALKEKSRKQ